MDKFELLEAFLQSADEGTTLHFVMNAKDANAQIVKGWMKGRLKDDDLLLPVQKTRDGQICALVRQENDGLHICNGGDVEIRGVFNRPTFAQGYKLDKGEVTTLLRDGHFQRGAIKVSHIVEVTREQISP